MIKIGLDATKELARKFFGGTKDDTEDLKRIAVLIDNIEQLYHQNFISGMNSSLYKILKKCRAEYGEMLIKEGIENTILKEDRLKTVTKLGTVLPTIYLHYYPKNLEDAINSEQREYFLKKNTETQKKVDFINSCKAEIKHDILALKQSYLTDSDGFLFRIHFETLVTQDIVMERIDFLISELERISLDAAIMMFDEIEWISIQKVNPFLDFEVGNQEVAFTFIDLKNHLPSRSILYFLKSFRFDLEKVVIGLKNEQPKIIDFQKSYNEDNGSFLKIKLRIQ